MVIRKIFHSKIFFIFGFLSVCLTLTQINGEVVEVTDSNFHDIVISEPFNWLIMFYIPSCPHCKKATETLQQLNNELDSSSNRIAKINCDSNHVTCMEFEIKHVPYFVNVVDGKYAVFDTYPSKEQLKSFLTKPHEESSMKELPARMGYFQIFLKTFQQGTVMFSDWLNSILKDYNVDFTISPSHSYIIMIGLLFLMVLLEITLILCCCSPKKKAKTEPAKEPVKEVKKEDKSEEPKEKNPEEKEQLIQENKEDNLKDPIQKKND